MKEIEYSINKERFESPYSKIVSPDEAIIKSNEWRNEGKKVIMVDAVLDIPHYRHPDYFLRCANLGDKLILRVNSDEFVAIRKYKGGPIVSLEDRQKHACHYPYIDLVTRKDVGGWDWLADYKPSCVVKSITSGKEVLEEMTNIQPYLEKLGIIMVVMDEHANVIPIDSFYEAGLEYEERKYDADKFSGSIIKKEIIKRYNMDKFLN